MVLVDRNAENIRNGRRSRGSSPNGAHGLSPEDSSDDDNCKWFFSIPQSRLLGAKIQLEIPHSSLFIFLTYFQPPRKTEQNHRPKENSNLKVSLDFTFPFYLLFVKPKEVPWLKTQKKEILQTKKSWRGRKKKR